MKLIIFYKRWLEFYPYGLDGECFYIDEFGDVENTFYDHSDSEIL